MGINKKDIKGVIHYNMPKSLEHFVQEVGRCGRDGQQSQCHLFLSEEDYTKLRSLAYSDGIDEAPVNAFLKGLFDRKRHTTAGWGTTESDGTTEQEEEEGRPPKTADDEAYLVGVS